MTTTQELIKNNLGHLLPQFDVPLAPLTYFKIGGPAEVLIQAKCRDDALLTILFCRKNAIPLTVLAGMSNIIIADEGIKGVLLIMENEEYQILKEKTDDGRQIVRAGVGNRTALFVRQTVEDGFAGLEYFLGVPGKLGGAIYNNAHYLTDLISDSIYQIEVINEAGEVMWLNHDQCEFGYDSSRFQKTKEIILRADFALRKGKKEQSMELIREATLYRAKTQPLGEPSSGCYFQNAPNTPELQAKFPQFSARKTVSAGFLIDQAGLKGKRLGKIAVSEKHAAFLINLGNGTSEQVKQLAEIIKKRVQEQFGVELKEEVFWIGPK